MKRREIYSRWGKGEVKKLGIPSPRSLNFIIKNLKKIYFCTEFQFCKLKSLEMDDGGGHTV